MRVEDRRMGLRAAVTVLASTLSLPLAAVEFSAQQMRSLGERELHLQIYVTDEFVREEMSEGAQFRVIDLRQGRMRIHNVERKEYMDLPAPPVPRDPEQVCAQVQELSCTLLGEEMLEGRRVQQWVAQMQGPQDRVLRMQALYDPELRYPLWMKLDPGMEQRLEGIQIAPQDPALFQTPAGFMAVEPTQRPES